MPALIGAITLAGRRWGPAVAGWLSGFPIVTGPILLFVALEQGPRFAAVTASGALSGGLAWMAFALSYAWAATRLPWGWTLPIGLASYLVVGLALVWLALPFMLVVALVVGAVLLAPSIFPLSAPLPGVPRFSPLEIYVRMLAGGALTVAVTRLSPVLGPKYSGLFAVFPVMGIVLAAFSHRASGSVFTIRLLRGMVSGFYAFTAFCLMLAVLLERLGTAAGFFLALLCSLAVHLCVLRFLRRT